MMIPNATTTTPEPTPATSPSPATSTSCVKKEIGAIPAEVEQFLSAHPELVISSFNKIKCTLTNHEMPARMEVLQRHVEGKMFQRYKQSYSQDISQYYPYIEPTRKDARKVYCGVTRMILNRDPIEIQKHINGRLYKRKIAAFERKMERKKKREEKGFQEGDKNEEDDEEDEEDNEEDEDEDEDEGEDERVKGEDEDEEEEVGENEEEEDEEDEVEPKAPPPPLPPTKKRNRPRPNKKARRKSAHKSQPTPKRPRKDEK